MRVDKLVNSQAVKAIRIEKYKTGKTYEGFKIKTPDRRTLGKFTFSNAGEVSNLKIDKKIRRKKEGLYALFAMKRFLKRLGQKRGFDYLTFFTHDENPNHTVRLYNRFATQMPDLEPVFMWSITKKGKRRVHQLSQPIPFFFEDMFGIFN